MKPYGALAVAIVMRARLDLTQATSTVCGGDRKPIHEIREEAAEFLQSDWAGYLAEICSLPKGVLTFET